MSDYDDFLDEDIEYRIFEESIKESGGNKWSKYADQTTSSIKCVCLPQNRPVCDLFRKIEKYPTRTILAFPAIFGHVSKTAVPIKE